MHSITTRIKSDFLCSAFQLSHTVGYVVAPTQQVETNITERDKRGASTRGRVAPAGRARAPSAAVGRARTGSDSLGRARAGSGSLGRQWLHASVCGCGACVCVCLQYRALELLRLFPLDVAVRRAAVVGLARPDLAHEVKEHLRRSGHHTPDIHTSCSLHHPHHLHPHPSDQTLQGYTRTKFQ